MLDVWKICNAVVHMVDNSLQLGCSWIQLFVQLASVLYECEMCGKYLYSMPNFMKHKRRDRCSNGRQFITAWAAADYSCTARRLWPCLSRLAHLQLIKCEKYFCAVATLRNHKSAVPPLTTCQPTILIETLPIYFGLVPNLRNHKIIFTILWEKYFCGDQS